MEVAEAVVDRLEPSRSIISSPNRRPVREERWISRSTAAKKKARLKRPVSESTVERRIAACRERRCSRAMYEATKASSIIATMFTATVALRRGREGRASGLSSVTAIT